MGLFGNTSQQTPKQKKLLNIDADKLNSNQQAVPVKYLAGRTYVAGDYISPAYNPIAEPIKSTTGKSQTSTTGYKYFCDFALVFCVGGRNPVDAVYKVIADNEIIWTGNVTRGPTDNKTILTMPNDRGTIHLYWGTETSPIDSILLTPRGIAGELGSSPIDNTTWPPNTGSVSSFDANPFSGHYDTHPAYRGQCYAVFKKWKLGRDRTSVQNIQLELKRGTPWFGSTTIAADDKGVNPIAVLYDWLTDPRFGMGMSDSQLGQTTFTNTFNFLEALNGHISPLITSQSEFRQVVAQLLEYFDGWIRRNGQTIEVGLWSHGTGIQSMATLTDDDLLAEPMLTPQGWGPTFNEITVVYRDREHHFNDYTQVHRDPNNFRITGGPRPETLKRDWITDKDVAKRYARESGISLAMPYTTGEITLRREWLVNNQVLPGMVITYNSGFYGLSFLLRVLEVEYEADKAAEAKMTAMWERSQWPSLYVPPGFQGPGGFFTGPRALYQTKIIEVPYLMADRRFTTQVAVLAVRGNIEVHGMRIWASFDGGTSYQQLPDVSSTSSFAAYAQLYITVGGGEAGIYFVPYGIDQDQIISQTAAQQNDDNLIAIVDYEFMSCGTITTGSGWLNTTVLLGRYGTTPAAHNAPADIYFINRKNLLLLDHVNFIPGATVLFKLQPFTTDLDYDLTQITPISYTIIGFGDIPAPVFTPSPGSFVTSVAVACSDPISGIVTRYTTDGTDVTVASPLWPQSGGLNTTITISDTATFKARFYSPDGRFSNQTVATYSYLPNLTPVSGAPTPPASKCGAPKWSFSGTLNYTGGNITLTNTTSGATIMYSLNGAAAATYSAPVNLNCTSTGDSIEFWATKTGLADSAHKTVNNTKIAGSGGGYTGGGGGGLPPHILQ